MKQYLFILSAIILVAMAVSNTCRQEEPRLIIKDSINTFHYASVKHKPTIERTASGSLKLKPKLNNIIFR